MPRTKLCEKYAPKPPPIDWLWAAVLERKARNRISLKDLAAIGGVSYGTMRQYARESPWDWPRELRENVVKGLGLSLVIDQTNIQTEGVVS